MPFLSLREDSFPWLVSTKHLPYQSNALNWNIGAMYCVQLTSSIIRINKRTIQWFILGQTSSTESWPYILNTQNMPGWYQLACTPITGALCETQDESKMLLFPNLVVDLPLNLGDLTLPSEMTSVLKNKTLCSSPNANRELNADDKRYEISLCDLVDNNLEFVYKPSQKKIFWRQNNISTTWLVISTLLTLFFFTKVCEHMLLLLQQQKGNFTHSTSTIPLIISIYLCVQHVENQTFMLMYDEVVLHYILLTYVLVQASVQILCRIVWTYKQQKTNRVHTLSENISPEKSEQRASITSISSLLCIQLLLTAEMQNSYDNPFLNILTLVFGIRNFFKFMNLTQTHIFDTALNKWEIIFKFLHWIVDTCVFISILVYGFTISSDSYETYMTTCGAIMFMSFLTGTALHVHSSHGKKAKIS